MDKKIGGWALINANEQAVADFIIDHEDSCEAYLNGDIRFLGGSLLPGATEPFAHVYAKFDGCTHWYFDDEIVIDNYAHICGAEWLAQWQQLLAFGWECAKEWFNFFPQQEYAQKEYGKYKSKVLEGYTILRKDKND